MQDIFEVQHGLYYLDSPNPDTYLYFNNEWYYWLIVKKEWIKASQNHDSFKHQIISQVMKLVKEGDFPPEMYSVDRFPRLVEREKHG